jgi:hypothetical protein
MIPRKLTSYVLVINILGILRNNKKNECKREIIIFGYKLDIIRLDIRLLAAKRIKL